MNESSFAGKTVWLTGASSGIGEALAHVLARKGASLVLSARREDVLHKVRSACAHPERHEVLQLDMVNPSAIEEAARRLLDQIGRVDILVHCAGISQRGPAIETQLQVDRHVTEVNYLGPVALTKQVLPSMQSHGAGQIVVISSLLGKFGAPGRSAYSGSKHALHGFFDSLRAEVHGKGIVVTMICPGFVRTNASRNALTSDGTPHGRMDRDIEQGLAPDDCARRIVRAIERRRREVYIGQRERLGVYLSRFAPGLFGRLIRRVKLR